MRGWPGSCSLRTPPRPRRLAEWGSFWYGLDMAHGPLLEQPVVVHTRPAIDRQVYRQGATVQRLDNPARLSGEPVLRGFVLEVPQIWAAMERRKAKGSA